MLYQRSIPTRCSDFFTVTVVYKDLSDLLGNTGPCELDITKAAVTITAPFAVVTLQAGFTEKSMYVPITDGKEYAIDVNFPNTVSTLTSISTLEKTLYKEASYIYDGKFVTVKYPTVWIRTPCRFVPTVMTKRHAETLAKFLPNKCVANDDVLEFSRGPGLFVIPRVKAVLETDFNIKLKDMKQVAIIPTLNLLSRLKRVRSSIGNGFLKMAIYKEGINLFTSREKVNLSMVHGDISEGYVATVDIPLEYLIMCASMVKEGDIVMSMEGFTLWIHSNVDILMSV
jgi:hypothetical protein